ncbi:uncharacterized protein KY384_004778 [Bacidia gigantensis]|uniref:uncharacterized protein n=1 Tax=Bacidia gigantensis TaxID=2732470 RepID=UPI001D04BE3E|nr:uncharacterized protein KY384_004778 [Bacidia gigantensis]KAG8530277.1 hypothetical protein KY384_004778 [Bacidia gigantensis]
MGEPLSALASVLAIAAFAAHSCECLHKTLRLVSEAPKEIQHHITAVRALQSTLAGIARLDDDVKDPALITEEFKARLQECMLDLRGMERLTSPLHAQLEEGKARRAWAKLSLRPVKTSTTKRRTFYQPQHTATQGRDRLVNDYQPFQKDLGHKHIQSYLQSRVLKTQNYRLWHFLLWLGPVYTNEYHTGNDASTEISRKSEGYGIALATALYGICPYKFELAIFLRRTWDGSVLSLSLQSQLCFPSIVPWEAGAFDIVASGDVDALDTLLATKQATIFDVQPDGSTLLHVAASLSDFSMIKYLLEKGARVNAMDDQGGTPLHNATEISTDYEASRLLIDCGADLLNQDIDGKTPLHTFYSLAVEKIWHYYGGFIDECACDRRGLTLLHYLAWSSNTPLETFNRVYKHNVSNLNVVDVTGRSILHLACQRGNVALVNYILDAAEHPVLDARDSEGRPALHYAVENKRAPETVESLVEHGSDLRARDSLNRSALHHAAIWDRLPVVKTLLSFDEMKDELHRPDCYGMTPLDIAVRYKSDTVLALLVESAGYETPIKNLEDRMMIQTRHLLDGAVTKSSVDQAKLVPAQKPNLEGSGSTWKYQSWPTQLKEHLRASFHCMDTGGFYRMFRISAMVFTAWKIIMFLWSKQYS